MKDKINKVEEVSRDLYIIDSFFAGLPDQCGVFLLRGEKNILVDCGTSVGVGHVIEGLEGLGIGELHYILLTHIHLDHAGGASFLLDRFPGARVLIYERRAKHLVAPEKLVKSAHRSLGDSAPHYGTMRPIPIERVIPINDGYELDIGSGRTIRAVYTPGHSSGHFAFLERGSGALFCGDSLGHLFPESGYIFPATPAPEFDGELSLSSARRLMELEPDLLLFPHYGSSGRCREVVEQYIRKLERSITLAEEEGPGGSPRHLAERIMSDFPEMNDEETRLLKGIATVDAAGILHYLKSRGQG
ncbi:MAG: MBL fold metallo-hydrolase [Actinobacteria bacterium]|nr:MBL fold metallo-hydrolase [Actinomycetota bacterium]MBU4219806.1 MBL fold metallo-hydrolase [Actinomycetota bacterium]MBU4358536.1 MBL fold metallo-hydrolase [Actinomycetota bacterium]MBU4441174.1 MBL fold metallo-hydrolase [Actinomycetota bacterium]MCG2817427.1 MBL fold metallo-hydrolase [Actinomycetes bacterium]